MFKNVASQKLAVYAHNALTDSAKTGDAANISAQISKDGGACAATDDAVPTELDATDCPGIYIFDMLQAETNCDMMVVSPVSSTSGVVIMPAILYPKPPVTVSSGVVEANIKQIDGQATNGTNATLNLKQLNISNSAGSGILAVSTGSGGHGMELVGNGTGNGLRTTGGVGGAGMYTAGGASGGHGFYMAGIGGNYSGLYAAGIGSGAGGIFVGGASGAGMEGQGGSSSGDAMYLHAAAGNGNGFRAVKHGAGEDINGDIPGTVGTVTTLTGHTVQSGDTYAALPSNFSDLSITVTTGRVDVTKIEGADATDQINAACDASMVTYGLDHFVSTSVTGTDITDNSIVAKLVSSETTADWDDFVNTTDSLQAIRDKVGAIPTVGSGAIAVDHDTGGTDNLAYKTAGAAGIDNATVEAYLTADYDAGNYGAAYLKGVATTDTNGRWEEPMMLDAEDYTFRFFKQAEYGPDTAEQTVS